MRNTRATYCSVCGKQKTIENTNLRSNKRWFESRCKKCNNDVATNWIKENPEQRANHNRKYYNKLTK